jgi:ferric-chelate reductase
MFVSLKEKLPPRTSKKASAFLRSIGSLWLWSLPGLELNMGQSASNHSSTCCQLLRDLAVIIVLVYLVIVLVCIILNAPLVDNPNRAGASAWSTLSSLL